MRWGIDEKVLDSRKLIHDGVEDEEINLVVVVVDAEDAEDGRKNSLKVRWKSSPCKLRRTIWDNRSGGS